MSPPVLRTLDWSGPLSVLAAQRLSETFGRVLGALGLSNYLAIASVADAERLCGRLIVSRDVVSQLTRDLNTLGLVHRIARFHVVERRDAVAGTAHRASFVALPTDTARRVLYFARKAEYCEGAEWAELCSRHDLAGEVFGYPSCCVRAFAASPSQACDRWPSLARSTGPFPRILNPVLFYVYGVPSLTFHFPCSYHCQTSVELAEARRAHLARLVGRPGLLTRLGRGIAFYGPETGIGLVTRYRETGPDEYLVRRVDTRDTQTARMFRAAMTLRLLDGRCARLDGRVLPGDAQFVVRFE